MFINTLLDQQIIKPCHQTNYNMNADDDNISLPKPAISSAEAVGSNPALAPPKRNKRKNHRGGRKTKKKQNSRTRQDTFGAPMDVAGSSTVEAIVPIPAKKQEQTNRKRCRKSAEAPTETRIAAPDSITERRENVTVCILKQDYISPIAEDDSTRSYHHSASSSTQALSPSRGVDEDSGARAETSETISAVEQDSVSNREGASGDIAIHEGNGLEAGFKSVTTAAETSPG